MRSAPVSRKGARRERAASSRTCGLAGGRILGGERGAAAAGGARLALGERTQRARVDVEADRGEVEGKRRTLRVGQSVVSQQSTEQNPTLTLSADAAGHFFATGTVNGGTVRFLVDTGATMISIGASDARRLGIDLRNAQVGYSQTANGNARVYRVRLSTVRIGDITLNDVDGLVHEHDLPIALLGMSFLNRMEMQRDGQRMILKKRY